MDADVLLTVAIVLLAWAMVSEWLAARNVTGPVVLMAAGLLLANPSWGIVSVDLESSTVHHLAELTLALLLFADASTVPVAAARRDLPADGAPARHRAPAVDPRRAGLALLAVPDLPLALAGLIAAASHPPTPRSSASVIADERLPSRVRRVLNVESGLNDGIATPVVTFCIAAAARCSARRRRRRRVRCGRRAGRWGRRRCRAGARRPAGSCVWHTGAGGCSTVPAGWPRWRWRCSRSSCLGESVATRSWPPFVGGFVFGAVGARRAPSRSS